MMDVESEVFKTSDTPLASYLVTEGYAVIDVIFNGSRAYFLFSNDDPNMQRQIRDFQVLNATTNASQIISNYQKLVTRTKRGY